MRVPGFNIKSRSINKPKINKSNKKSKIKKIGQLKGLNSDEHVCETNGFAPKRPHVAHKA